MALNSTSDSQAPIQDLIFDKGSDLTKELFYVVQGSAGTFEAPDLSTSVASMQARLTYESAVLSGWEFSSPSAELNIISIPGADLGAPYANLVTVWGVSLTLPASLTAAISWLPRRRGFDAAYYDIEIVSPTLGTFKLLKGSLFAAEEVTR